MLSDEEYKDVISWLPKGKKLTLLYKGSRDGFDAASFHYYCDNKGPTMTLYRSDHGYVFGGYTSVSWEGSSSFKADPSAYIFSVYLRKKLEQIDPSKNKYSIMDYKSYGPSFGYDDLRVKGVEKASTIKALRKSYLGPKGEKTRSWATYLSGANEFTLTEIEVYKVE